ncbi:MAG TPA: hypothetical protein VIL16_11640 [Trebonia sp.]
MLLRARTFAGSSGRRALGLLVALSMIVLGGASLAQAGTSTSPRPSNRTSTSMKSHRTATAPVAVPQGFVGVDADGPLFASGTTIDFSDQLSAMVASGVQSIRVAFNWASAQPYSTWADVPAAQRAQFTDVGGRPVDFQATDMIVAAAARHRVSVLPTVLYAPSWDATENPNGVDYPRAPAPYGAYLTALIGRYGPHGSFWRLNPSVPKLPIRSWQIWNEPNLSYYWKQPFAAGYVSLLRAAHAAIKRADPGAQVVLGALTNFAWKSIGQIYRIRGARNLFDAVAVNGFTLEPANVILYMRFMRSAMSHFGDGLKPLLATEISWPSAKGRTQQSFTFDTTEAGQARDLATVLRLIGADRVSLRLAGFYYYTWIGEEATGDPAFNFAGLLALHNGVVTAKPALAAFRSGALALERCRRKGAVATSCIK